MSVTISNGTLTARINPKGAELNSLKKETAEYIWEGNPEFWGKHSPVLFPIVGTLKNGSYSLNDTLYLLLRHGFARDNEFELISSEGQKAVFSLKASEKTKDSYPFDFELQLVYTLNNDTLSIEYIVFNHDTVPMPFSIGAHPAFALPGNFEDYSLLFNVAEPLKSIQLENDLLSDTTVSIPHENGRVNLNHGLFENDALIFTSLQSRSITINKNNTGYLKVDFPDFPHLGIWTKPGAPFVCIEPWQGYSDSNNASGNIFEKEGVLVLEPGKSYSAALAVSVL